MIFVFVFVKEKLDGFVDFVLNFGCELVADNLI